jgi:hypothetical protein
VGTFNQAYRQPSTSVDPKREAAGDMQHKRCKEKIDKTSGNKININKEKH